MSRRLEKAAIKVVRFMSVPVLISGAFLFFNTMSPAVLAQQANSGKQIRIIAEDELGNALPGAAIEVRQAEKVVTTVVTDAQGRGLVSGLAASIYQVGITREGFEPRVQNDVSLRTENLIEIKFILVQKVELKEEINVSATVAANAPPEQSSSTSTDLGRVTLRQLANQATTVTDALPLLPGVVRSPQGEIKISGTGENRSAFIVNSADVTDPATGQFGMTIPVDSVQSINVFKTPYLAQYGRFTSGVVSVETRRGGDKWNFELNDPLPEFRYLNGHLRGLREATPRVVFNGPLIKEKLFISEGSEYTIRKRPVQTLEYPNKETISESINSFTQIDYFTSATHTVTGTFHFAPRRDSFVNLDFFNRRPVTPNWKGRDNTGTVIDRLILGENLLESTLAIKRYTIDVWGQGNEDMVLTPTGNLGNYFSDQERRASRVEWIETLSLKPIRSFGTHNLKFGTVIARTSNRGQFFARPVSILDQNNQLNQRIDFAGGEPFDLHDTETYLFGQDHWTPVQRLAFDMGLRFERQSITGNYRVAPRLGLAWAPFSHERTVFRAGYGFFYDRVPLSVYAFGNYPRQVITTYAPDGSVINGPVTLANITDKAESSKNPFIRGGSAIGNFAPYSATWNVELEHSFSRLLKLRVNYLKSNSSGVVVVEPRMVQGQDALVLGGGGKSRYRQFEVTARFTWGGESQQQLFASYVNSRILGNINEFNTYIGNFPFPVVRTDQFARLGSDLPHRFLAWGAFSLPWKMKYSPIVEYRNGFPFSEVDVKQNFVGVANSQRFPNFFSFDSRLSREFQINPKYAVRFALSGFNMTNHFNALDVHRNVQDPRNGIFFGNMQRFFRLDFDVIF